jgi:hypothetical protein
MRPGPPSGKGAFLHAIEAMTPEWIFEHPSDITRAFDLWC